MEQEHLLDQITREEIKKPKRPVVVTVICIVYFLLATILIPTFIIHSRKNLDWAFLIIVVYLAIIFTFVIAIWKMKKWGAHGFIGFSVLALFAMTLIDSRSMIDFLIPLICSILLFFQLNKME